ncbi:hypothetical protein CTAM01_12498 [Colletotrichum tamarilloi]|uniref:Uncharacterized protein n=1 Tax=Colletotrichum tamarilloi TaxID=1209934 RepID=A0ABQ9QUN8_9PEZI|nr:uncharacterized protein CTAM01_12498 [Colletotrichum tamarilloi]KAK1485548.1 hypothetical protein CTAM01_12498 [Colletotrichum tamarilloi]
MLFAIASFSTRRIIATQLATVQAQPTVCSVCEDIERLEVKSADMHRWPYEEFSVKGGTLKEVAESRSCVFCTLCGDCLLSLLQKASSGPLMMMRKLQSGSGNSGGIV